MFRPFPAAFNRRMRRPSQDCRPLGEIKEVPSELEEEEKEN